jgi:hypothetical protein
MDVGVEKAGEEYPETAPENGAEARYVGAAKAPEKAGAEIPVEKGADAR